MIKATHDNIIIKQDEAEDNMYGSILVPDMGKEIPHTGVIISTGPGRRNDNGDLIPMESKVGDKVILPKIGPVKVKYEGVEYLITSERNILAQIEEKTENE